MAKLTFKEELCKGCGLCVTACPKKIQGLRALRDRMPEEDSVYFKDKAQPQGPRPGRADEARGMRRMRELRDDVPRLRDYCRKVG